MGFGLRQIIRSRYLIVYFAALLCLGGLAIGTASAHQPHDPINAVAVSPNFATDHTIFAATGVLTAVLDTSLLLKSTDDGITFQAVPNFPNYQVASLAISSGYASDQTLFAATDGGGLLKSTDGGSTWTNVSGPAGPATAAVSLSPQFPSDHTLFVASVAGLFTSSDGGTTWRALTTAPAAAAVVVVSPNYPVDHTVFVGTAGQSLYRSVDGGASWTPVGQTFAGNGNIRITAVALSPNYASDQTVLVGTWGAGSYLSHDGGATWAADNVGLDNAFVLTFAVSPDFAADQVVFAGTRDGTVYKSTNGATSWAKTGQISRLLSAQTTTHVRQLAISPNYATDQTAFLAMFDGMWRTSNGGGNWLYSESIPPSLVRSYSVSPTYSSDHTVYASHYGGGMVRTTDSGQSWQFQNTGLADCYPNSTSISPNYASDNTVVAATVLGPATSTTTPGNQWNLRTVLGVPVSVRASAISPNYSADHTMFVGVDNLGADNPMTTTYRGHPISTNGLFASFDGGTTWWPTTLDGKPIHTIAFSPNYAADGTVFAGSLNYGLFKSTDRGTTWNGVTSLPVQCCVLQVILSPNYATDKTLYVSVPSGATGVRGLYRSTDDGATWVLLPGSSVVTVQSVAISRNFAVDHTLFVGTVEQGVLVSTDGGNTLTPTSLSQAFVTAVAISPAYVTDRTVFAAAYAGMFVSRDGGATWTQMFTSALYAADRPDILRIGSWQVVTQPGAGCNSSKVVSSSTVGSKLRFTFSGSRVGWVGSVGPNYGIAKVYIDGTLRATVDLYRPAYAAQQQIWLSPSMPSHVHYITIEVTGQQNASSTGTQVTLDGLTVSP